MASTVAWVSGVGVGVSVGIAFAMAARTVASMFGAGSGGGGCAQAAASISAAAATKERRVIHLPPVQAHPKCHEVSTDCEGCSHANLLLLYHFGVMRP